MPKLEHTHTHTREVGGAARGLPERWRGRHPVLNLSSYTLSWMNLLTLLLVYLSSPYFTLLSSNLLLSCGGRKRTTPLPTEER